MTPQYDFIIIGAGIYGFYAAHQLSVHHPSAKIIILEYDAKPFQRASYINQARVHNGYHYPRSLYTAIKSAHYYNRFIEDYSFAINQKFKKIYAISSCFSETTPENFAHFCKAANIPCQEVSPADYFQENSVDASFITEECSMDGILIAEHYMKLFDNNPNIHITFNARLQTIKQENDLYKITFKDGKKISSDFVLNTTYASINQILDLTEHQKFKIKYELAEICLCTPKNPEFNNLGLTVMDGTFFSVMPFGYSNFFSLTAVHYTPHKSSRHELPTFECQKENIDCTPQQLANCNTCAAKPNTAWDKMEQLSKKFLNPKYTFKYEKSLFTIKAVLSNSEITDARPTVVKVHSEKPHLISVLSGKFNTIYDLDEVLQNAKQ